MDRRTVIADAAIGIVASRGLRALTHRALDADAGLPPGSTSYYFRTKADLLVGVSERLIEVSRADHIEMLDDDVASSIARYLADALAHRMHHLRARYALMLDPILDVGTQALLARSFFSVERAEELFHDPAHAAGLVALCEGVLADAVFGEIGVKDFGALRFTIDAYLTGAGSALYPID